MEGQDEQNEQNGKLARVIVGAQMILGLMLVTALLRGITLSILWGWFIQRLGVPSINAGEAIGIALVIGFLITNRAEPGKKAPFVAAITTAASVTFFTCAFALLFGFVVHLFI